MEDKTLQTGRLPWKVKICYATGAFSKNILAVSTAAYLLFFYTDICGVDPKIASTIILAAKIWDIINDPMMGAIVDKSHSKEGKCRIWLKYFSVPAGIILALTFFMPGFSSTGKAVWVAVTYVLQGMASTVLLIPTKTLLGRITIDRQETAQITQLAGFIGMAGTYFVTGFTMKLVGIFGGADMQKGFMYMGMVFGVLYMIGHLVVYFGTKGYDADPYETETVENIEQSKASVKEVLQALMKNWPWLCCIGLYMFLLLGDSLAQSSMPFYFQYNHAGMTDAMYLAYSNMTTISSFAGIFLMQIFIKKFGNAGTAAIGCLMASAGYLFRFILQDSSMLIMNAGWIISGFGSGLVAMTIILNIFDAKVYGEWKTGVDNEAILMSGFSVSYKIGMAIGGPIAGYLLLLVPYVQGAEQQADSVLSMWMAENTLIPGIATVISLVFAILIIKNEKKVPQMRKEIEERKKSA